MRKDLPLEKEVEAAFFEYLQRHYKWEIIKRQVKLPLGIADIVGFSVTGNPCVVEVKRGVINRKTVGQLIEYIGQVNRVVELIAYLRLGGFHTWYETDGILVGKSISKEALNACKSLGYTVYLYDIESGEIAFREAIESDDYLFYIIDDIDIDDDLLKIAHKAVDLKEDILNYQLIKNLVGFSKDTSYPKETLHNQKFLTIRGK